MKERIIKGVKEIIVVVMMMVMMIGCSKKEEPAAPTTTPGVTKKIAFVSYRDGNYEIYKMDADGSNVVRLTNNSADDGDPDWEP